MSTSDCYSYRIEKIENGWIVSCSKPFTTPPQYTPVFDDAVALVRSIEDGVLAATRSDASA